MSSQDTQHRVVRAVGAIGLATLASRVLGYVRDMVVAGAFGAGVTTDAFFVAYRIPNLLRRLLAEGALSTAIVPVFTEYLHAGSRPDFTRMVRAVTGAALVVLVVTVALGALAAPWIVAALAPGWTADRSLFDLAVRLTRVMFPYAALVALAALASGLLNTHGRFFVAAFGPVVLNVAMIASVLVLAPRLHPPILALGIGVLVGGLGQLVVQLPSVRRLGVSLAPSAEWRHPAVRTIASRLAPAAFGLAAVHVTVVVNTLLASLLPGGTVSYLYYADRVMEFPLGVFGIALATAVLPTMSAQAARGERAALVETLGFALRLSAFIALPAAAGLVAAGGPIVSLLFERGAFGTADAAATARALAGYAVGLPAFSATRLAAQAFYAMGDTRTPVRVGMLAVAANVAFALGLMWPLAHAGLALASSLSAYVNAALLCWILRRRLGPLGGRAIVRSLARSALGAAAVAGWCAALVPAWDGAWPTAARVLLVVAAGAGVHLAVAALLRAPELRALAAMARRRASLPPPA
jgi:putative peptidoglycan lipid II flippase